MGSSSFKIFHEVRAEETGACLRLSHKIPFLKMLFGHAQLKGNSSMWNAKIKKLRIDYKSRAGPAIYGNICFEIKDMRVDREISDQVVVTDTIDAKVNAIMEWESSIWLPVTELADKENAPFELHVDLMDTNIMPGSSIGRITLTVTIELADTMHSFSVRIPKKVIDTSRLEQHAKTTSLRLSEKRRPMLRSTDDLLIDKAENIIDHHRTMSMGRREPLNKQFCQRRIN